MKTNSGAKKSSPLPEQENQAETCVQKSHLDEKTKKQKRNLTHSGLVHKSDLNSIKTLLALK